MPSSSRRGLVPIPRQLRRTRGVHATDMPAALTLDSPADAGDAVATPAGDAELPAASLVDAEFALTRPHVDALLRALDAGVPSRSWPATPDRLRSAVEKALGQDRATGAVLVTRLPRALHSTESWHIRLSAVTTRGRDRVAGAVSAARLAAPDAATDGASGVR